jgi:dolichol-phosphate mannosyltransferase
MNQSDTVIIIPTYNERNNIALIIPEIQKYIPDARILVVDDNSPDKTADVVREINSKDKNISLLFRNKKEGLGKAYVHAFRELKKDSTVKKIITMDADFSHDPMHILAMQFAAQSHDVVVGSRYVSGGATEGWEPWRKALSKYWECV